MVEQSVNFDRATPYYDQTRGFPDGVAAEVGAHIADVAALNPQSKLLEIGIGTGRIALPLAPHVASIAGMDISRGMMNELRTKQSDEPIHLAEANGHHLPYASDTFDAAYITHVLHLVPDPERVLQEAQRVVKPDGCFLHMRNKRGTSDKLKPVIDVWNQITRHGEQRVRRWDNTDDHIEAVGWEKIGEYGYNFTYQNRIGDFVERIQKRQWSSTWLMDDDLWQQGVDAVLMAVDEYLDGDMDISEETTMTFLVQVYKANP